ncbi:alkaline phosphatase family protein [Stagonosporopsis vannaccii]|nr:alkaline phosphatase family protein [Stagonosporopsis vannaccii]
MAENLGSSEKASRTRSRSGCLSCRRRRRDGAQPRCQNCRARGEQCSWGLKASFHPSRAHQLSDEDSAALLAIEEERALAGVRSQIVNDTDQVVRDYCFDRSLSVRAAEESQDAASGLDAAAARLDSNLTANGPDKHRETGADQDSQLELTLLDSAILDVDVSHATTNALGARPDLDRRGGDQSFEESQFSSTRNFLSNEDNASSASTFVPPFSLGQAVSLNASPLPELELPVSDLEQSQLISAFLQETGTWCETTDSERHFTVCGVHEMMDSKAFTAAAMALASRQLDAVKNRQRQATLRLYQHAIQLLIHQDPSRASATILATCTLLCVYEMMASEVGEWRRHLKGCAGLLRSKRWNGSSLGIINACFWAFARIDVWAAFMTEEKTLIPTDSWVNDSSLRSVAECGTIDAYCNLATLVFAKITNLIAESKKGSGRAGELRTRINALWRELQDWRDYRPRRALPLLRTEPPQKSPFQVILFTHSSSICGNTFYHAGSILLLQAGHVLQSRPGADMDKYDPVWHAKELCGISTSNPSHANWVNHLQPLYIAGKAFGCGLTMQPCDAAHSPGGDTSGEEEHPAEKIVLLRHLARIERETGWKTSGRAAELRKLWGFG